MTVDRQKLLFLFALLGVLFAPVVAVALFLAWVVLTGPGYLSKTQEFRNELRQSVSPSELQEWAMTEIARADGQSVELRTAPSFLRVIRDGPPSYLVVKPGQESGEPYVLVAWGGGFGHWGLKAGSSSFRAIDDASNYHLEWEPGLYAWHEIR
jgi:hypothetical protein